ncbi:MAG: hypothetical protein AAB792_00330, partial [Patescibacteria group bacterium]
TKFFIISSAVIFVLERVLSIVVPWPIFIFPVFVVLFGLLSTGDILAYLPYVAVAAIFFDFFSGLPFGWFTIAMLAVFLTIYLAHHFLNIGSGSFVFTALLYLVFITEYFLLLSIRSSPRFVISQAAVIAAEAIILLIPMRFLFGKLPTTHY